MGFRLRLVEVVARAVNVVLQPGHWDTPRVDHLGFALDEDEYDGALERAADLGLKIQDHPGKRTFIATEAGYRLEVHRHATGSTTRSPTPTTFASRSFTCALPTPRRKRLRCPRSSAPIARAHR